MIQARARAKESQPLCLEEVLISQWPGDLFKRATAWISTCAQKLEPRSVTSLQIPFMETPFTPSLHLERHKWVQFVFSVAVVSNTREITCNSVEKQHRFAEGLGSLVRRPGRYPRRHPGRDVYMKPDHFRELFTKQQVPL